MSDWSVYEGKLLVSLSWASTALMTSLSLMTREARNRFFFFFGTVSGDYHSSSVVCFSPVPDLWVETRIYIFRLFIEE